MIANYGYKDGSGSYFISIDTDKCDGCNACVEACPAGVLEVMDDPNDPLSDNQVAIVTEAERKKLKYTCAPCKPVGNNRPTEPCIVACPKRAITHSW